MIAVPDNLDLRPGECDLWVFSPPGMEAELRGALSDDERRAADRYRFEDDRRRFATAHAHLREILGRYLDRDPASFEMEIGAHGKPFLPDRRVEFNISHSGELVIIGFALDPIGVDGERIRGDVAMANLAKRYFHEDERAWLEERPEEIRERSFFRLWTIKEAAIKADGRGLAIPLPQVRIDVSTMEDEDVTCTIGDTLWHIRELDVHDGYCASFARSTTGPIRTMKHGA